MSRSVPPRLQRLLDTEAGPAQDTAWDEFLEEYHRLILYAARGLGGEHDAVMDRYAYVLAQLRDDHFRRLRGYAADGRGKFTTWLMVVIRRLCLDQTRSRYGRKRGEASEALRQRRDLADLVGGEVEPDLLAAEAADAEESLRLRELHAELGCALEGLEPADRLLLRLRFEDEASVAEIARICSYPTVFHVYRNLNRIFGELKKALRSAGVTDPRP